MFGSRVVYLRYQRVRGERTTSARAEETDIPSQSG